MDTWIENNDRRVKEFLLARPDLNKDALDFLGIIAQIREVCLVARPHLEAQWELRTKENPYSVRDLVIAALESS